MNDFELLKACAQYRSAKMSSTDKAVLCAIASFFNSRRGCAFPSLASIKEFSCCGDLHTVIKSIKRLEEIGVLRVTRKGRFGNEYRFSVGTNTVESNSVDSNSVEGNSHLLVNSTEPTVDFNSSSTGKSNTQQKDRQKDLSKERQEEVVARFARPARFVPEEGKGKPKRCRLPYQSIPLKWWIACDKIRPRQLNPWAVFEEFREYWTSDCAVGRGLKADWDRTWANHCRKARANPSNQFASFNGEYRYAFRKFFKGTADEQEAEAFFFAKTHIHDFGDGDCEGVTQEPQPDDSAREDAKAAAGIQKMMGAVGCDDLGHEKDWGEEFEFA